MKKKKELVYKNKGLYDGLDKKGMVITGFGMASNEVMKELCINYHTNVAIIYFMLLSHRNKNENKPEYNQCFPTKELLGKETGLSEDTVEKCIKTLKDNDYILYRKGNSQYANQYYFPLEEFYKGEGDYLLNVDDEIVDEIIPPVEDNSVGYINEFCSNMNKYYNTTDETLLTNKAIIKRVNSLVGNVQEELVKNNLDNKAEKVITDIMKSYKTSFGNSLKGNNIDKDFNKCTYLISCIQNTFKNKKLKTLLKHNKADIVDFPPIDNGLVDYMNDNFIELSNGERESKKEIIRRMEVVTKNPTIKDDANKIASNVFKDYNYRFTDWNSCHINIIRDIVKGLEDNLGNGILIDGFDGMEIPDIAI